MVEWVCSWRELHRGVADELVERVLARWDAARSADLPSTEPKIFDLEAMLTACVPGGYSCDPQVVADDIRAWFSKRDLPPHPDEERMDFLQTLDCDSPLWQSFADSMFIRQAIDAARAQAGKEGA